MSPRSRGVRALQTGGLAVAAVLACLLVLELALRLLWSGYYPKWDPQRPWDEFDFHPVRGYTPGPGVVHFDRNREYQVWLRHNSAGFRSPEIAREAPPDRTRLMVVGDSQTYGTGVENDEAYPAVLERLDPSLQVINAGVPGYGPDKQLLLLRETIGTWSPDLVVLAFFWNDLFDARQAEYNRPVLRDGKVHFVPPEPASPEHPAFRVFNARKEKRARRYAIVPVESRLYRFVSDRTKLLRYAIQARLGGEERRALPRAFAPGEEDAAWPLCYALLREIAQVARTGGARFALLVVPDQVQVEPDVSVYAIPDALWKVQERIAAFAAREGIALIDPLDAMRARRQRDGRPLYHRRDRHLNPEGHRHMGELLLAGLRRQALLDEGV